MKISRTPMVRWSLILFVLACLCSSCERRAKQDSFSEFMEQVSEVGEVYKSTNVVAVESTLLEHRDWLMNKLHQDPENSAGYETELFWTTGRLFRLYDLLGSIDSSQKFFMESASLYSRVNPTEHTITKDELRAKVDYQDSKGVIGWRQNLERQRKDIKLKDLDK